MSTTLKWPMAYILACIADTLNHLLRATPMVYAIRGTVAMQATYMYDSNGFTTDYLETHITRPNTTRPYQLH